MDREPLISVCIPAYNGQDFIACTLTSVLDQSFKDFEVVIVDDNSTDATVSVIKSFSDPRIRLIQNETNLGLGANWNKALSCARGKYVKLLCGDDVLRPECLARHLEFLEDPANSDVVLAVCNRTVINSKNQVILRAHLPRASGRISGAKLIRQCARWGSNLIGEPVVGLFRRKALQKTKMCDPANPYTIDLGLWAELLRHGDAFLDDECLASFRVSEKAATAKIGFRHAAYFRQFVRALRHDPFYHLGFLDSLSAYVLSFNWCLLRNLFIRAHSTNAPHPRSAGFQPAISPGFQPASLANALSFKSSPRAPGWKPTPATEIFQRAPVGNLRCEREET